MLFTPIRLKACAAVACLRLSSCLRLLSGSVASCETSVRALYDQVWPLCQLYFMYTIVACILEDVVPLQLILCLRAAHVAVYLRVGCAVATIEEVNVASGGPFSDAPCAPSLRKKCPFAAH